MQNHWVKCNDCFGSIREKQVYYKCLRCADTDICSNCFSRTGTTLSSSIENSNRHEYQHQCQHQYNYRQLPQNSPHRHHILLKVVEDDITRENTDSNSNSDNFNNATASRFSTMTLLDGLEIYGFSFDQIALCTGSSSLKIMERLNIILHSGTSFILSSNEHVNGNSVKKCIRIQVTDGMNRSIMLNESKKLSNDAYFTKKDTITRNDRFSSLLMNIYTKRRQKESWSLMVLVFNAVMKKGKFMGKGRKIWKKLHKIVYTTKHRNQIEELLQKFRHEVLSSYHSISSSICSAKLGLFHNSAIIFNSPKN